MRSLLQAGARVQDRLASRGFRFCFIGGIANFRWGTPRLTNDLDLTVLSGFGGEAAVIATLLEDFAPRITDASAFALEHRVLLLQTADGFAVDVALGAMPFEEGAIARATDAELSEGATLRTCSATDLVVHKAFAGRPQDWVDIEGVLVRQKGALDWPQLWADLAVLSDLKEDPEILAELERVARRAEAVVGTFPRLR
ncbi:MAG: hypothetical protein K2X99_07385 [Gemmatimonadaceae bacterium]|nr:hypothetical protein [Gemmatimonadaceae bacterium]